MRNILLIVFILAGVGLVWHGFQVRDSLKGKAQELSSDTHKALNGNSTVTDATWFMIGGSVLIVAGVGVAVAKR